VPMLCPTSIARDAGIPHHGVDGAREQRHRVGDFRCVAPAVPG
jgi:hypothetical protein